MPPKKRSDVSPIPDISANLNEVLEEELARIRATVETKARVLSLARADFDRADDDLDDESSPVPAVQMEDLSRALQETLGKAGTVPPKAAFFDLFPPFSCLCFLMCLIFGGFGLFRTGDKGGFLDIAKIFAGALVGSTTSTVIGAARSRRATR